MMAARWLKPIPIAAATVLVALAGYLGIRRNASHAGSVVLNQTPAPVITPSRQPPAASALFSPPRPLTEIYSRSSHSVRTIHSKDWERASQDMEDLHQIVESLVGERELLPPRVASPYAIDDLAGKVQELRSAIDRRDRIRAELIANQISGLMIDMLSHYDWPVPQPVARLDYLGRDVIVWSEAGNFPQTRRRVERLRREWQQVRPLITRRGSVRQASDFDELLRALAGAKSIEEFQALSEPLFDRLSSLAAYYH